MQIKPLGTSIFVKVLPPDEVKGLLHIPSTSWQANLKCKVIAVGKGKKMSATVRIPLNIKVGDVLFTTRYAGTKVIIDGTDYLFLKPIDVLGILEE